MLTVSAAVAQPLPVEVNRVLDGDTVDVFVSGEPRRVRLDQIDAPEGAQAYGEESRARLEALCLGKRAGIEPVKTDRYGRTIAKLYCDGKDAGAEQVRNGAAWVYWRYARDAELFDLQTDARRAKAGLWAEPDPTPPWLYRHRRH